MHQINNQTPFQAAKAALVDKNGNQTWVVVVKATYVWNDEGLLKLAPEQEPVCPAPRYFGEPGQSSLLRDGEFVTEHPGTDITLLGTAYAPRGNAVTSLLVTFQVGTVGKTLQVFGNRIWSRDGAAMSAPQPFVEMPITYERAYGGSDPADVDPRHKEPRNPIGVGFASRVELLAGKPLPNIEDPSALIRDWKTRPPPSGFGPIPPQWSPRVEYAGTFDDEWAQERMPLLPRDYDPRQTHSAHPDLVSPKPLQGGEDVVLRHLTPNGAMSFKLPRESLTLLTRLKSQRLLMKEQLDRVIVEPDARKLVMVWRASLNCKARVRDVIETRIDFKPRIVWERAASGTR